MVIFFFSQNKGEEKVMNPKERTEGECGNISIAQGACVCTCLCEIALSLQWFRPHQLPGGRKPCARHAPSNCKVTSTWNKCVSLQSCTLSQGSGYMCGLPCSQEPPTLLFYPSPPGLLPTHGNSLPLRQWVGPGFHSYLLHHHAQL